MVDKIALMEPKSIDVIKAWLRKNRVEVREAIRNLPSCLPLGKLRREWGSFYPDLTKSRRHRESA
ncbi:hypothetical protein [Metallosphaera hakonensis]|uniref:hypothetical protein n=1 Tax=Metallosphaera hakonensis TaxID=79601 RepID=UPI002092D9DA|nr:hypothetical protein [Metallosphaera hakonensis]